MKKWKYLLLSACAVLLVAATTFGTVAYLTDTSEVVNTFTVGRVDIRLDEAVVDENGVSIGGRTEKGNEYHLLPGATYTKDPTVTVVKGSEESYVRMLVTINCYDELTDIFGESFLPQYFVEGWDNTVWLTTNEIGKNTDANTATYEFRYYKTVKADKDTDLVLEALFDKLTVPGTMTADQLSSIADLEISVEAHAIQAAGFASASDAWADFTK